MNVLMMKDDMSLRQNGLIKNKIKSSRSFWWQPNLAKTMELSSIDPQLFKKIDPFRGETTLEPDYRLLL